ncbi:MAG: hypothetical protein KF873_02060 [Gemmataceae bacterium]|nr:hypothetical protein [Gemmataceae bacterium]
MKLEDMTEPQLADLMTRVGQAAEAVIRETGIDAQEGGRIHFILLLFKNPQAGECVATCDRKLMIDVLQEAAYRFAKQEGLLR